MKIVVLDGYAANPGDLNWDELRTLGECEIYDRTAPDEVLERSKDAEAILTNKVVITAEHMASLPNLKYIGVIATGYNIIDVAAAKERGITVTNIPAYSTPSVGQMVFAHILNITQRVQHYADEVREGRWTQSQDFCYWDTPLIELLGKKIGLIGLGQTGYNTARIAIGFGMKVWAYTSKSRLQLPPEIRKAELDQIFRECDIVSLHCPLNNYKIYAAGLDVLSTEPPRADNPLLTARNCFITPHIAWATSAARERLMAILVDNLKAYIGGKPVNNVAK